MKCPHDTVSSIHLNHREAVTVDNNKFRHLDVCDFYIWEDLASELDEASSLCCSSLIADGWMEKQLRENV